MAENMSNRPKDENAFAEGGRPRSKKSAPREKKAARYPLNLFDLLVILVVLVAIVLLATGVRLPDLLGKTETGRACRVEYTVTFRGVDEQFATAIAVGDAVLTADTGACLGNVTDDVEIAPHQIATIVFSDGEDSTVVMKDVPGKVDITVTVQADAVYTEGVGYTVSGQAVRVGTGYHLRFPNYVGIGSCNSLGELTTS